MSRVIDQIVRGLDRGIVLARNVPGLPITDPVTVCEHTADPGFGSSINIRLTDVADRTDALALPAGTKDAFNTTHTLFKISPCVMRKNLSAGGYDWQIELQAIDLGGSGKHYRITIELIDGATTYFRAAESTAPAATPPRDGGGLLDVSQNYSYNLAGVTPPTSPAGLPGWLDFSPATLEINPVASATATAGEQSLIDVIALNGHNATATIQAASIQSGSTHGKVSIAPGLTALIYEMDPTDDVTVVLDYTLLDGTVTTHSINVTTVVPPNWLIVDAAKAAAVGGTPDGSRGQPYASFPEASVICSDGDVISIAGSQPAYDVTSTVDMMDQENVHGGSNPGARGLVRWILHDRTNLTIRVHARTSSNPILTGNDTNPPETPSVPNRVDHALLEITNCRNVVVRGLEVRNSNHAGIVVRNVNTYTGGAEPATVTGNTDNVTVEGCYVHDCKTFGILATPFDYSQGGANPRLTNINILHNVVHTVCTAATATSVNQMTVGEAIRVHNTDGGLVAHNQVSDHYKEGINLAGCVDVIRRGCFVFSPNLSPATYRSTLGIGNGMYCDGSSFGCANIIDEGNIVLGEWIGMQYGDERGESASGYGIDGAVIRNNIVQDCSRQALHLVFTSGIGDSGSVWSLPLRNMEIYNNSFHHAFGSSTIVLDDPVMDVSPFADFGAAFYSGFELNRNLIVLGSTSLEFDVRGPDNHELTLASGVDENIVRRLVGGSATLFGDNSESVSDLQTVTRTLTDFWPDYENAAWPSRTDPVVDLQIVSGSPAIKPGTPLTASDLLGNPRTDASRGALNAT